MSRYIVLAAVMAGTMMLNNGWAQKKVTQQGIRASIAIPGKRVPDRVVFRRVGKDLMQARVKNNVVSFRGTDEIVAVIGPKRVLERLLKGTTSSSTMNPLSSQQLMSTRDTTDFDGDRIPAYLDACPCAYGPENDDPSMNGCPVEGDAEPCLNDTFLLTLSQAKSDVNVTKTALEKK